MKERIEENGEETSLGGFCLTLYNYPKIKKVGENVSEEHIAWHPAFVEAIQAELEEYKDALEFRAEYPLTTEPLRIDVLIIKKRADVVIEKNIARIFRERNIIEYKSPDDHVSRPNFQKTQAYAWLYASLKDVSTQNLTVTLVESGYSRRVIQHLETDLGYDVEENEPGIYAVKGMPMPVQIIDSEKLDTRENLWLKNLRREADVESLAEVLRAARKRGKGAPLKAYMYVLLTANLDAVKEVTKMMTMTTELREVFRSIGFDEEWEKKVRDEGRKEGEKAGRDEALQKTARSMLIEGLDSALISRITALPAAEIEALRRPN
jgi:hypothetical protein